MSKLPINKIDSHAHIFTLSLPMKKDRRYTPAADASLKNYLSYLDQYQFHHGVLIQPSFLGTENSFLLTSIKKSLPRLKGVICIEPSTSLEKLKQLDSCNIVGVRLNLINKPLPDFTTTTWKKLLRYIKKLDWHIEIHCHSDKITEILSPLIKQEIKVVIDHFGRPLNYQVSKDYDFLKLLKLADSGFIWCKISGIYRIAKTEEQTKIFLSEAIPLLIENFGAERLMWGSDWPHTQYESRISYTSVVTQIDQYLTDNVIKETILYETPAKLFKFID